MAAAFFELDLARFPIELVMDDQAFFGLDLEKTGECTYGFS